jgi:hypothetical protein
VGIENRLRSDPVSLILDELCQDDDFPQHDEMDQEDFGGPDEVYGNENDYPVEYPLDHQYEKEQYPIDHQPKDVHYRYEDDIHDEDLFESVPSKKHIPSSPIVIEDTSTSIKRKLKKALFPSNTIHSSPRDTFRGYGIGSTLKNPQPPSEVLEIFSDYDISQESDTFVNLQKARENGDTAGLENYFNQFDAAPVRKRKQKESVPKAKKPWKGKNYQYKRYKRKK